MARTTRPLTHTEVQKAKALDKDLTLHDGDGLFLLVKTTGKKIWRFRYQLPNSNKHAALYTISFQAQAHFMKGMAGSVSLKSPVYW